MKLVFLEGKIYSEPKQMQTREGKTFYQFSLGISNSYKSNGEWIKRDSTFISLMVYDMKQIEILRSIAIKKDKVSVVARFDVVEKKGADNKIHKETYYNAIAILVNNKDFYSKVQEVLKWAGENSKEAEYKPETALLNKEGNDDLPF